MAGIDPPIPDDPRVRLIACSALDERWLDGLDDPRSPGFRDALGQSFLKPDVVYPNLVRCTLGESIGVAAAGYAESATVPWS